MQLFLKSIYQTIKIRTELWFYSFFAAKRNQSDLVKQRLRQKKFKWQQNNKVKVFAIFCINNWESALLEPLKEYGELYHFNWTDGKYFFEDKKHWQSFHDELNIKLQTAFNDFYEEDCNMLVFIYASDFILSRQSLEIVNRSNSLVVSFCWDDLLNFRGSVKGQPVGVRQIAKFADINLSLSPEALPKYRYYNSPSFFWKSLPVNVKKADHGFSITPDQSFYVLFIGSKYGWRSDFIEKLIKAGFRVLCYGTGWENGYLTDAEMIEAIRQAPVALGFANVGYTKSITTIKGRDFEVPLYGGLYLTQFSKGLAGYYQLGEEVLTYHHFSDCITQLNFIKHNHNEASTIREAGYQKALQYGSWHSRFAYLSQLIDEILI